MQTNIITAALLAAISSPAFAVVTIDWVTIGDAGNAAQSAANRTHSDSGGDGFGAVDYNYRMARNETTIAQYTSFLNAVATTDPYGLYNTNMASDGNIAGISRSGTSGSYTYSVIGSGDRPITYVSWFDAARFTNWLHNGQGNGDTETGAYTLNGATSGIITKNVGATVWIPTEDEWFKAAYYDPTHMSGAGGYWLHANQSNSMTGNTIGAAGAANYIDEDFAVTQSLSYSSSQNYLTDSGAYGAGSQSYYGTNDQAGNVFEWNDSVSVQFADARGLRGGAWENSDFYLSSSNYVEAGVTYHGRDTGFRLASIPEPSTALLTLLSSAVLLRRRRA
jgi:sulfatase modifying factor 1